MCAAPSEHLEVGSSPRATVGFRSLNQLCEDFQQRAAGGNGLAGRRHSAVSSSPARAAALGAQSASGAARKGDGLATWGGSTGASSSSAAAVSLNQVHTGTLKKLFREKGFGFVAPDGGGAADVFLHFSDLSSGGSEAMVAGMRVRYTDEVDSQTAKVRARNVAVVTPDGEGLLTAAAVKQAAQTGIISKDDGKGRQEKGRRRGKVSEYNAGAAASGILQCGPVPRSYTRNELLRSFDSLRAAGRLRNRPKNLRVRTVLLPWDVETVQEEKEKRRRVPTTQNPRLDDEARIAEMEARLSRESGADRKNSETFGTGCTGGWTFEEALKANSELSARWSIPQGAQDEDDYPALPFTFEDEEEDEVVRPGACAKATHLVPALRRKRSGGVEDTEYSTAASPESESEDLSSASESGRGEVKDRGESLDAVKVRDGVQLQ
mmetsp:Transcript_21967/g.61429  ORF Transcript_21967/g.61429 Transcript_21967/m.61429 type:complete len:435 (-) Transcript_21967:214-1518(-)